MSFCDDVKLATDFSTSAAVGGALPPRTWFDYKHDQ
jgi:hypothetical protein